MKYEIGKRIKYFRKRLELSQKEAAKRLNISNAKLSNWEKGINRPPVDFIANICTVLDITADELLGVKSNTNQSKYNLSFKEKKLLNKYRELNLIKKNKVLNYIETELKEQKREEF